jgi:hypothetical protein
MRWAILITDIFPEGSEMQARVFLNMYKELKLDFSDLTILSRRKDIAKTLNVPSLAFNVDSISTPYSNFDVILVFADYSQIGLIHELSAAQPVPYESTLFILSNGEISISKAYQIFKSELIIIPKLYIQITQVIDKVLAEPVQSRLGKVLPNLEIVKNALVKFLGEDDRDRVEAVITRSQLLTDFNNQRVSYSFPLVVVLENGDD